MAEDFLLNFFLGPLAPDPKHRYPIPRGTPSAGCKNTRSGKILQFSTELAFYLETVRDRPIVAIKY